MYESSVSAVQLTPEIVVWSITGLPHRLHKSGARRLPEGFSALFPFGGKDSEPLIGYSNPRSYKITLYVCPPIDVINSGLAKPPMSRLNCIPSQRIFSTAP